MPLGSAAWPSPLLADLLQRSLPHGTAWCLPMPVADLCSTLPCSVLECFLAVVPSSSGPGTGAATLRTVLSEVQMLARQPTARDLLAVRTIWGWVLLTALLGDLLPAALLGDMLPNRLSSPVCPGSPTAAQAVWWEQALGGVPLLLLLGETTEK